MKHFNFNKPFLDLKKLEDSYELNKDFINKQFSDLVVIGMGGSTQGARAISNFANENRIIYFDIGRIAFLQANVLSAYVFLAPAIVAGVVTLGVMQQIIRAFGRVEGSMQYLLKAWPTIIELASVYKRLREFEFKIEQVGMEEISET